MVSNLPIDERLPDIIAVARDSACLVLEAEAGAGKTTRVPAALLDSGLFDGEIWVTEPRRLAARLVALRVASERNEQIGLRVGYTVRFDDKTSASTRLRYVTGGILVRRLASDPELSGIDCVVLDEFHERSLETDLALALLLELQKRRPELRVIVMSATLDGERISRHLGHCPRIYCQGRPYPLTIEHEKTPDARELSLKVKSAVRTLVSRARDGSILVFLAGSAEIRKCGSALAPLCDEFGYDLRTLHGDMSLADQTAAIAPGKRPRVVLTTNVAESSVTVDGITAVVDSGMSRRMESTYSGVAALSLVKVSRASAVQRAGRAGRIAEGHVIRLFTKGDFDMRPEHEAPEILRMELSECVLQLSACCLFDVAALRFLDPPDPGKVAAAQQLLRTLEAIDDCSRLTPLGQRMLALGIHPRLARLAIACADYGHVELGARAASILSERSLRIEDRFQGNAPRRSRDVVSSSSDLLELVELLEWAQELRLVPRALSDIGVDSRVAVTVDQTYQRLRRQLSAPTRRAEEDARSPRPREKSREQALSDAALLSFSDRVAKRRAPHRPEFVLRTGQSARLVETSSVVDATFIVALDVDERRNPGRPTETVIRVASAFDPSSLLDVEPDSLESDDELMWTDPPGRVEVRSRIRLGSLTIEESRRTAKPSIETAQFLLGVAVSRGLLKAPEVVELRHRLALLKQHGLIQQSEQDIEALLGDAALDILAGATSLDGLDGPRLASAIVEYLKAPLPEQLRNDTPTQLALPGGKRCKIHYEDQQPPWIESRLQDFFGLRTSPTVVRGRVALTIHLLAPNQRAVQITNDLCGFWSTHYPSLRRQLMRRYPRHPWPEDGATAAPPEPRAARSGR